MSRHTWTVRWSAVVVGGLIALAGTALGHAGSLGATGGPVTLPGWIFYLTGGGVVGASFLFTSFVTDRALIRASHTWTRALPVRVALGRGLQRLLAAVGVVGLVAVVLSGLFGTTQAVESLAVLLVWVGWWAGFTMTTYLAGNSWPAVNPWATMARYLPARDRPLPVSGSWLATTGLLGLVFVEVVSPLADDPRLLAGVVVAYSAVSLAGATVYGRSTWFDEVDPVTRVFRTYGAMAPIGRVDGRLTLRPPGAGLASLVDSWPEDRAGRGAIAFVIALLWGTTYDGLVTTPVWARLVEALVATGVPGLLVYLVAFVVGFVVFFGIYQLASRRVRTSADTYRTTGDIARRFAPSLVPIAAGYHLAHYLSYFLAFVPTLATVLTTPLSTPESLPALVVPGWLGSLGLLFVILGHMLAVWVAHTIAFRSFVGRLQPIRSQYPYIIVMTVYTVTSMAILAQPYTPPPALP